MKNIHTIVVLLIVSTCCACDRKLCSGKTFSGFSKLKFTPEDNDSFVKSYIDQKTRLFSKLCISDTVHKFILIESRKSTESFYHRGLVYTYFDSALYFFSIKNDEIQIESRNQKGSMLTEVLTKLKRNFHDEANKLVFLGAGLSDAPIMRATVFDDSIKDKFYYVVFSYVTPKVEN